MKFQMTGVEHGIMFVRVGSAVRSGGTSMLACSLLIGSQIFVMRRLVFGFISYI